MENLKYMTGTTGTTYLQIGQKGNVGVGVRLYPMNCVNPGGLNDKTYFVVRVRIAHVEGEQEGPIQLHSLSLDEVWTHIPREKQDDSRHSSFFGFYLDTNVNEDPEGFLNELHDGKFRGFCAALIDLVGEDTVIVDTSDIQAFLSQTLDPGMAQHIEHHHIKNAVAEVADVPGFHLANYIKKQLDGDDEKEESISPIVGAMKNVVELPATKAKAGKTPDEGVLSDEAEPTVQEEPLDTPDA